MVSIAMNCMYLLSETNKQKKHTREIHPFPKEIETNNVYSCLLARVNNLYLKLTSSDINSSSIYSDTFMAKIRGS